MVDRKPAHEGKTRRPQTAQTLSSRQIKTESAPVDELIAALASARENRRAQQVGEWEQMYHARRVST
jgi:hypothetical protein